MFLDACSLDDYLGRVSGRSSMFVGAVSFEERCTHVPAMLAERGVQHAKAEVVDYRSEAAPAETDRRLRAAHRSRLKEALRSSADVSLVADTNPYSDAQLRKQTERTAEQQTDVLLYDITCFTRAHVLALASVLAGLGKDDPDVFFSYTAAETYDVEREAEGGWRDVLLLPVGKPGSLRREGHARGVVFPGHDAERLSLALNDLEPGAGTVVFTKTMGRPDLARHALQANSSVARHLMSLRMPRPPGERYDEARDEWRSVSIVLDDYAGLCDILSREVGLASTDQAPIIIYPFGPKNLILATALRLADEAAVNVWAVYPVPFRYSIDYSHRSARVHWMRLRRGLAGAGRDTFPVPR